MARQLFCILSFSTLFAGCNFSENIKNRVDSSLIEMKVVMAKDLAATKTKFKETYDAALLSSKDSTLIKQITKLHYSIHKTSRFMDSLQTEINKLDDDDLKNIELIKRKFLNEGLGDSVFNKVRSSYACAIEVAPADTTKSRLKRIQNSYTTLTKKQIFEQIGPLGVNLILYGIESELIDNGTLSLAGYKEK